ncbi:hypothetical protein PF005_g25697 [Phytophthora fragariae]|uniref:Uncharacterized protein n=1 Tax=Phytophthora fragariae TaxID=53985 RepID=A0A6A3VYM6_9STRA|nr:hypothetical protein PF003_g742 [Phytophthora fragariae]KAE8942584.1 hypothetical protein PF009_g7681 [Phytophthora fragariae]KAE9018456.1 hypothetical protein PF011_g6272 [Phytophthora fragariae]KAE9072838.1 hypothetical protein PF010_g25324 [Phytophthora fragariae]KAE9121805.1 hypothetical protein PF007_g7700 [Phytophthora fragariae]
MNMNEEDLKEYTHIEDVMVNIGDNQAEDEQNQDDAYVYY